MSQMPISERAKLGGGPSSSDRELLRELKKCARKLKRTPGHAAFDRWLGRKGSQILQLRFGSWSAACEAAGLEANARPASDQWGRRTYNDDDVLAAYLRIREAAGGPPTIREWARLQEEGEISCHALRRRCSNSWVSFLREMEELLLALDLADAASPDADRSGDLGVSRPPADRPADSRVAAPA